MNDFRRRKAVLAFSILGLGMLAACLWHGSQRWLFHRGYPYCTFLYDPGLRFSDYLSFIKQATLPNPYTAVVSYFPLTYTCFEWARPDRLFLTVPLTALFWGVTFFGLLFLAGASLRPVWERRPGETRPLGGVRPMFAGMIFLFLLYPTWFCVDRGNIELFLALLVAASVYMLARHRYGAGMAFLVPAICFKLYPAVLLALYLRRRRMRWIFIGGAAVLLLSFASLLSFAGSWRDNAHAILERLALFNHSFAIEYRGLGGTATLWNVYKVAVGYSHFQTFHGTWDWREMPSQVLIFHQKIYSLFMAAGAVALTLHVCLVETQFLRRVILLLLFMVVAAPIGADYKLLHVGTALIAMILLERKRRHDFLVTALLAFALIPKKEILLPFLGPSDSHHLDISIGIFLTPLSLLLAAALLVWDGFRQWSPRWGRQRLRNLLSPLLPAKTGP